MARANGHRDIIYRAFSPLRSRKRSNGSFVASFNPFHRRGWFNGGGFKGRSLSPLLRQFYPCISLQNLVERIPLPRSCLSFVRISFVSFPVVENVFVILLLLGDRGTIPSKQIERDVVRYNIVRPVHALLRIRPTFHTSNARMPIRPNPFATGFAKRNSWRNIVSSLRTLHAKLTNNWTGESSPLSSSSLDSV